MTKKKVEKEDRALLSNVAAARKNTGRKFMPQLCKEEEEKSGRNVGDRRTSRDEETSLK